MRLLVGRFVSVIIQSEIFFRIDFAVFFRMDFAGEVSAAAASGVGAAGGSMHAVRIRGRRRNSIYIY